MPFPLGWPPRPASGQRSIRFAANGTSTANFFDSAFLFAVANQATAMIGGADVNGSVLVSVDAAGAAGNAFTIQVVIPTTGHPVALSAAYVPATSTDIVVTLATTASGQLNTAANTATLVTAAVTALALVTALANGTGATALSKAEAQKGFSGGGGAQALATPYINPGQATATVRVGSPMGSGSRDVSPTDPYAASVPMAFASTILIKNDDATATNTLLYSFDGINTHGIVRGGETEILRYRAEAGVCVRAGAGTPAFRIVAW